MDFLVRRHQHPADGPGVPGSGCGRGLPPLQPAAARASPHGVLRPDGDENELPELVPNLEPRLVPTRHHPLERVRLLPGAYEYTNEGNSLDWGPHVTRFRHRKMATRSRVTGSTVHMSVQFPLRTLPQ